MIVQILTENFIGKYKDWDSKLSYIIYIYNKF
jgi:hypothetical protein